MLSSRAARCARCSAITSSKCAGERKSSSACATTASTPDLRHPLQGPTASRHSSVNAGVEVREVVGVEDDPLRVALAVADAQLVDEHQRIRVARRRRRRPAFIRSVGGGCRGDFLLRRRLGRSAQRREVADPLVALDEAGDLVERARPGSRRRGASRAAPALVAQLPVVVAVQPLERAAHLGREQRADRRERRLVGPPQPQFALVSVRAQVRSRRSAAPGSPRCRRPRCTASGPAPPRPTAA